MHDDIRPSPHNFEPRPAAPISDIKPAQPTVPPAPQPEQTSHQAPVSAAPAPAAPARAVNDVSDQKLPDPAQQPAPPQPKKEKGKRKPVGIIITAVVVFLGLAGGVVYLGWQKTQDKPVAAPTTVDQPTAATNATTDTSDIDQAIKDGNSFQDSQQDISSDLTDQALEL